jgi:CubicO group peptidase (beta-lactamase class C family)
MKAGTIADRRSRWSRRSILVMGLVSAGLARVRTVFATQSNEEAVRLKLDAIARRAAAEARAGRAIGIAMSVSKNGVIFWETGIGVARKESATPATAHTPFSIASITKTFTAAAVMRLVQAGKLELDVPIDRYLRSPLPHSGFNAKAVTLRLLGGHAAGLPTLFEMFDQTRAAPRTDDLIREFGELAYSPGERYEYANLGYSLLGEAVNSVTGRDFSSGLNDLVIRPMGLRNSFFDTDRARMVGAAGRYDTNGRAIPFYTTATPPSGELYASAHDLSVFAADMLGIKSGGRAPLLGTEALDPMFSPVFTSDSKAFTTFGWSGRDVAGERIIVKTGGQPGVSARLTLLPARRISIAVISNRDDTRKLVADISSEIALSLMPDWSNPDFQMDNVPAPGMGTHDYDGSWAGSIRNGGWSERLSLLIDPGGASQCTVGGSATPIRDLTSNRDALVFRLDRGLSATAANDGAARQLDFKLIHRGHDLVGRCLDVRDRPGFTSTEPYVLSLSRA